MAERRDASRAYRLTPRQLQAALLARDGLKHSEIAMTLGISSRQVQRLLGQARKRRGAASTAQLVAMLVTDDLAASPSSDRQRQPTCSDERNAAHRPTFLARNRAQSL